MQQKENERKTVDEKVREQLDELQSRATSEAFVSQLPKHVFGPAITAANFELKPSLIRLVQQNQFGGGMNDDPHMHLWAFLTICDTVKMNGVSEDIIRLRLFPFSLRDKAKSWLYYLQPETINTWGEMSDRFLLNFFPIIKSLRVIEEMTEFKQLDGEPFHEAWERYKELMWKCPQHSLSKGQQVCFFYNKLDRETKNQVSCGSTADEAMLLFEEAASNSYQWHADHGCLSQVINEPKKPSMVDLFTSFMEETRAQCHTVETRMDGVVNNVLLRLESLVAKECGNSGKAT